MANTNVASYISPNAASITGVLVAAVAARFFAREELKYRQLGVLLFKVRPMASLHFVDNTNNVFETYYDHHIIAYFCKKTYLSEKQTFFA